MIPRHALPTPFLAGLILVAGLAGSLAAGAQGGSPRDGQASSHPVVTTPVAPRVTPTPETPSAPAGYATLLKGPDPVRGLPFFPANAIPALRGVFRLGNEEILIWSTREPVVFGSSWTRIDWPELAGAGLRGWFRTPPGTVPGSVPGSEAVPREILALAATRYTLFLELPARNGVFRSFALAFERRFAFFFDNAATDAELSFPAWIAPKR